MATADVIVVGAGTAGMPAAIRAAEEGARVLLVEGQDRVGGTLWTSTATMSASRSRLQRAKGIDDSPEQHQADCNRIGRSKADQSLLRLATEHAGASIDWLADLGVAWSADSPRLAPEHELYETPRSHYPTGPRTPLGGYVTVIEALERRTRQLVDEGRIELLLQERLVSLIVRDGRVQGIVTERDGRQTEHSASVVVLTTGGYGGSPEELQRRHPQLPNLITVCLPHADGSGMRAAEAIGAVSTRFEYLMPIPGGVEDPKQPGRCLTWTVLPGGRPAAIAGDIWVNSRGQRFVREDTSSPDERERALYAQGDNLMYAIFDHRMRNATDAIRDWTEERLVARGLLVEAATIPELASRLGLDPAALTATVERYNQHVTAGHDADFGRERMPFKIEQPPFYGVRTKGVVFITKGGLKVNDRLEVLDASGQPIPGLLAAGEIIGGGQIVGEGFCSGMSAGPAITFGRLAGERAARAALAAASR